MYLVQEAWTRQGSPPPDRLGDDLRQVASLGWVIRWCSKHQEGDGLGSENQWPVRPTSRRLVGISIRFALRLNRPARSWTAAGPSTRSTLKVRRAAGRPGGSIPRIGLFDRTIQNYALLSTGQGHTCQSHRQNRSSSMTPRQSGSGYSSCGRAHKCCTSGLDGSSSSSDV
jgi:hypothetical protein